MERKKKRLASSLAVLAAVAGVLAGCTNPGEPPGPGDPSDLPIIFVHGIYGSGDQFRAQALRFASNGYPQDRIKTFDYNSTANFGVGVPLNAFVDRVRTQFGVSKVRLVGHSLGTSVVNTYVSGNAAKVDRYVLVDGLGCGGGNCQAIRAASLPATGGGVQTHVEATVSPESFAQMYRFFTGRAPQTTDVVAQPGEIEIAGKVAEFQANTPVANTRVTAYEVDPATGARVSPTAVGSATTGSDGVFPKIKVTGGKAYELAVTRQGVGTFHAYYQPFMRSDFLLYLNTIGPNSAAYRNSYRNAQAAAVTVVRNREMWRNKGAQNDQLTVKTTTADGRSQPEVDVFKNVTGGVVGVWIQDNAASPGQTTNASLAHFSSQPFQTGVDIFMPAALPTNGTISIVNTPRGNAAKKQTINAANWPSNTDAVLAEFNDWVQ